MWGAPFAIAAALFSSSAGVVKENEAAPLHLSPPPSLPASSDVVRLLGFGTGSKPCSVVSGHVWSFLEWANQPPPDRLDGEFFQYQPPLKIARAVTPECRRLIVSGGWPELGRIVPVAERDDAVRGLVCALDPPEAASRFATWIGEAEAGVRSRETGAACAAALFRRDRRQFDAVVGPFLPHLDPASPPRVPWLTIELAMQLEPTERAVLLPALESATRAEAEGVDRLREIVCEAAIPSTRTACVPPAPPWLASLRCAIPPRGWAAIFLTVVAIAATTVRRLARRRGLRS